MLTYIPEELAPGCFGSALAFKREAPICSACVFAARCQPLHEENLAMLRQMLGVRAPKTAKQLPKEAVKVPVMAIAPMARALVEAIETKGIKVTDALRQGRSPFANTGLPTLHVACTLLLHGTMKRETLVAAFVKHLKYGRELAEDRASHAIQALQSIGAVDVAEHQIMLRR